MYRERTSGDFRLQPFGRLLNGSSQPFGQQENLPSTASDTRLTTAMLRNPAKNDQQIYEESSVSKLSPEEQKRVLSQQQLISIHRSGAEYQIIPFKRMGNSFGSVDEMIRVVASDEFVNNGGKIVRQLFEDIS